MADARQIADAIRFVFVSFEFLALVAIGATWYFFSSVPETIGTAVGARDTIATVLTSSVPLLILGGGAAASTKILFPSATNRVLVRWPDFPLLKNRVVFSLALQALGVCAALAVLLFVKKMSPIAAGVVTLVAISLPAISLFHCILASLTVRQIMEQLEQDK